MIVVGSDQDLDAIERARAAGAADHILVPVDQRDFHIRARGQLRRPAAGRSAAPAAEPVPAEEPAADADRRSPEGSRRAYETLLRLIDVIPRMICVTGRDGRYLLVNRHVCLVRRNAGEPADRQAAGRGAWRAAGPHPDGERREAADRQGGAEFGRGGDRRPRRQPVRAADHQGAVPRRGRRRGDGGHRLRRHHPAQAHRARPDRGQGAGRAGEPQQDRVRRQYEPRAAHAVERDHRLLAGHRRRDAGTDRHPEICRLCPRHPDQRRAPARHHQRHPRRLEARSRQARPRRGRDRPGQDRRRHRAARRGQGAGRATSRIAIRREGVIPPLLVDSPQAEADRAEPAGQRDQVQPSRRQGRGGAADRRRRACRSR